ncbi:MAG: hypothetical protein AAB337_00570 [Patescibacteria group bacterium]
MTDRLKRLLLLIGFFLIVFGIAVAIYLVFFRGVTTSDKEAEIAEEEGVTPTGGLPSAGVGAPTAGDEAEDGGGLPVSPIADGGLTKTTRLTSSKVIAPTLSADGKSINYYDPKTGQFYTINNDGEVVLLSSASFPDAESIVWSDTANEVIVEFPDGSNVIYDFEAQNQTTLPEHWQDFDFSPDGEQVIAKSITIDPNARALIITNTDTSGTKVIAALGENGDKVTVNWSPNDQVVAFSDTGTEQTGFGRKMILAIGKNEENFDGLIVEGLNFKAIWTPKGDRIVYSVVGEVSNYKPLVWIVDATSATMGEQRRSLGVNTWIDKCTFADDSTLYCAVPLLLENNAGLQRELVDSDDAIYKINIDSGLVKLVGYPEESAEMSNLTVSTDGSLLYYTDARGRLQFMRLR